VKFGVTDNPLVPRLAFEHDGGLIAPIAFEVPVETVVGDIDLRARKPFGKRRVRPVQNGVPFLKPVQFLLGYVSPKSLRILLGALTLAFRTNSGLGAYTAFLLIG
jgi:hypothetical protein